MAYNQALVLQFHEENFEVVPVLVLLQNLWLSETNKMVMIAKVQNKELYS
jgi:hypothetical protein